MGVRALRRVLLWGRLRLGNFHIETDGQILWRIAGFVVAGLITQGSAHNILARLHRVKWPDEDINPEVTGVNVQLLVGSEGKTHILPVRVGGFADDDVGRRLHLERGGNKVVGLGMIGIDVIAASHVESNGHGRGLALGSGDDRGRCEGDDGTFRPKLFLRQCPRR